MPAGRRPVSTRSEIAGVADMLRAADRDDDFAAEIARLRREHARKRTLMSMLTAEGW